MTSRRIMVVALFAVAGSAYFIFFKDRNDFVVIFAISLIILMVSYIFQYQIDQLMIRGVPQQLPEAIHAMLMHTAPHYTSMDTGHKKLTGDRMMRWIMKKEFIQQNEQAAPEDLKYMVAYYAILLTLHQEDYLYKGIDRIVFYHHPFLSPAYPDEVHIAEVETKDGTIILSVPDVIKGHLERGYYNLAAHVMAEAYKVVYMADSPSWPEDIWEELETISSMSREKIEAYIGLPVHDPWPVAVHHHLTYAQSDIPQVVKGLPHLQNKA